MKKFISVFICICLSLSFTTVRADNQKVDGLHEKLSALYVNQNFTPEQIDEMNTLYVQDYDYGFWNDFLPATKFLNKTKTDNDEDEYEYWFKFAKLDFSKGIKVTLLDTSKYIKQYADNNVFKYLFSNREYWSIPSENSGYEKGRFTLNGDLITDMKNEFGNYYDIMFTKEALDFIYNEQSIQEQLLSQGESSVNDIKIIALYQDAAFMYIKSSKTEYLIKLYESIDPLNQIMPNIELYKLYPAKEIVQNFFDEGWTYINTVKPTYETEALALQADGLIQGNENGLDLLKPLTRIEATAILVRAMGFENTSTSETSYFSDIPSDNWGAKYANIACDKGIATGVGDNLFAPNDTITASQFATLILRNTGENPNWQTAINTFVDKGLITSEQAQSMDLFTRGDMAKLIYEANQNGLL